MVALVHTGAAFLMPAFVVVHVYLTTTGHTMFAHIMAMITGWEDLDEHPPADAKPHHPAPAE
jgi:thiosulfate reductase cytochrome b subunit